MYFRLYHIRIFIKIGQILCHKYLRKNASKFVPKISIKEMVKILGQKYLQKKWLKIYAKNNFETNGSKFVYNGKEKGCVLNS